MAVRQNNSIPLSLTHLIDSLNLAGTQTALVHLARGLARRGYRQRVYCLNNRTHPRVLRQLDEAGVEVIVIGKAQLLSGVGLLRLYRGLRGCQVVQTFLPVADVVGRTLARLARVPVVVTSIRARNVDKRGWQLWLDRLTMRWAHRVVFNARNVVDFAVAREGVRPDQVVVIPNGVRVAGPRPGDVPRARYRVPDGVRVVGTVGRLRPQKGIGTLLEAFPRVRDRVPAQLWIIGEGPLRAELEAEARRLGIAGSVRFWGERSDVPELLACMDVYAHAALFEGMPNAVMEAMAAGLPVVASEVDGTRELIREGETGWLVPPGEAAALAARLLAVLDDAEEAARVGQAAARHMAENFSVEKMVDAFDALYQDLTGFQNL